MTKTTNDAVVGLDVGSSKILCVVARPGDEPEHHRILGLGDVPAEGMRHGTVVNVEEAVQAIRRAVVEAQFTSGVRIERVCASIGGKTLSSFNCSGAAVARGREISPEDVQLAEANARQSAIQHGQGKDVLKLIPRGYLCGDVFVPKHPVGLAGPKLEAYVHALYASTTNAQNLKRCIQRSGLELVAYEPHAWAAAQATLSPTEMKCGALVIDIGAETTSMAVFREGFILFSDVRPWGAEYLTRDIAMVLGVDMDVAEEVKTTVGTCEVELIPPNEVVQVGDKPRPYARELIARTLLARTKEFFDLYKRILTQADLFDGIEMVVLTGGGALLKGIAVVAGRQLGKRVRIGCPQYVEGENPLLRRPDSTVAMGLLRCVESEEDRAMVNYGKTALPNFFGRLRTVFLGDY